MLATVRMLMHSGDLHVRSGLYVEKQQRVALSTSSPIRGIIILEWVAHIILYTRCPFVAVCRYLSGHP